MTKAQEDQIIADGFRAIEEMRAHIAAMEKARHEQPERLAAARSDADVARGWALIEEPFDSQVKTITSTDGTATLSLPNIMAKELWGARLCFDILDCGDDYDEIDAVIARLFSTARGDTGITMTIMASALSAIAGLVVPQLLQEIEHTGSNWDERVRLCEARAKAWNGRVSEINDVNDESDGKVRDLDAFDIASNAMDSDDILGGTNDEPNE